MPEVRLAEPTGLVDLLTSEGLAATKSEARRLVQQGGVKLDGERVDDIALTLDPASFGEAGRVLQVGKRKFLRVTA